MIERYKPYEDHAGWTHGMEEAKNGQYVRFTDYDALKSENFCLAAELATWRQIGTANAARIEGLEAALRACTEKGANIHVIARDALTAPERGEELGGWLS